MRNEEYIQLKVFLIGILCSIFTLAFSPSFISAIPITAQYTVEVQSSLSHCSLQEEEACIYRNNLSQPLGRLRLPTQPNDDRRP